MSPNSGQRTEATNAIPMGQEDGSVPATAETEERVSEDSNLDIFSAGYMPSNEETERLVDIRRCPVRPESSTIGSLWELEVKKQELMERAIALRQAASRMERLEAANRGEWRLH
ncbi:hypothetical protein OPT61_g1317 [Boeremia exigua]|uniref:Uncharacterized protein n=1 Tax=Boeremia exigua TaxID=749465 RepID=A0ACC2IQM6_9PLEO|nr:hypothetical protein OPT61_g1317 [Boeremia exigua]